MGHGDSMNQRVLPESGNEVAGEPDTVCRLAITGR